MTKNNPASAVKRWNEKYPIGTPVRYWPGVRPGNSHVGRTKTTARVLGGHTAVVWVKGYSSCLSLAHVEVEAEMTKEEFEKNWIATSGCRATELIQRYGFAAVPCDCGENGCEGWRMLTREQREWDAKVKATAQEKGLE